MIIGIFLVRCNIDPRFITLSYCLNYIFFTRFSSIETFFFPKYQRNFQKVKIPGAYNRKSSRANCKGSRRSSCVKVNYPWCNGEIRGLN